MNVGSGQVPGTAALTLQADVAGRILGAPAVAAAPPISTYINTDTETRRHPDVANPRVAALGPADLRPFHQDDALHWRSR